MQLKRVSGAGIVNRLEQGDKILIEAEYVGAIHDDRTARIYVAGQQILVPENSIVIVDAHYTREFEGCPNAD